MRFFRKAKLTTTPKAQRLLRNKQYDELIEYLENKHDAGEILANTYYFMGKAWWSK